MISDSSCSGVPPRRGVSVVSELRFKVVTEIASFGSIDTDDPRCPPFTSDFSCDLWSFCSDRAEIQMRQPYLRREHDLKVGSVGHALAQLDAR